MSYGTARPYAACFIILKRADGKVAFVLRSGTDWMNGYYGLPAGKVEQGESYMQATVRETKEEAGVVVKPADLRPALTCHRKAEDETEAWVDVFFETSKWEGEVTNAEPHKHSEIAWFSLDALPKNTIPVLRFMLEQYQAGKAYCEYGWEGLE